LVSPPGFESNVIPFVLRPRILQATARRVGSEVEVQVTAEPTIGKDQRVTLLLNQQTTENPQRYAAIVPPRDSDQTQITATVPLVNAGRYWVRLQVDGAESLLEVDANGLYTNQPGVEIP
jgi:hypothetical protein